jgi:hypothetical protein
LAWVRVAHVSQERFVDGLWQIVDAPNFGALLSQLKGEMMTTTFGSLGEHSSAKSFSCLRAE